jgi:hypothetical protein
VHSQSIILLVLFSTFESKVTNMAIDKFKNIPPMCDDKNITSPIVAGNDLSGGQYRDQTSYPENRMFAKLIPPILIKTYRYSRLLLILNFVLSIVIFNIFLMISNKAVATIPCIIGSIIGWAITDIIVSRSIANPQSHQPGKDKAA